MLEKQINWSEEPYNHLIKKAIAEAKHRGINLSSLYIIEIKKEENKEKIIFGGRLTFAMEDVNSPNNFSSNQISILKNILKEIFGQSREYEIFLDARDEVNYVMEKMRDYLRSHGGDVEVVEVKEDEGTIIVSMKGACSLCPSAVATMKAGIRRHLIQYLPWIKKVEPAEEPKEPNFGFKLVPRNSPVSKASASK